MSIRRYDQSRAPLLINFTPRPPLSHTKGCYPALLGNVTCCSCHLPSERALRHTFSSRRCDTERDQLGAPGHPAQCCAQSAQPHPLWDLGPGLTLGRRQSLGHEHMWFLTKGHSEPECSRKRNAAVNRRHWVVCQETLLHRAQEGRPQAPCPVKGPRGQGTYVSLP